MALKEFFKKLPQQIETDRLVIRPPDSGDVSVLTALANNRKIHERLARLPHPYTEADAQHFIENVACSDCERAYAIALQTGQFVGIIGLHSQDGLPEIGYWLGEPYWGRGYATEAVTFLIDASAKAGANRISSRALSTNSASCHVLEKAGFRRTEEKRGNCGPNTDVLMTYFIWED